MKNVSQSRPAKFNESKCYLSAIYRLCLTNFFLEVNNRVDGPAGKAINSINHVNRFSKKLQRRLTKRTIAEMKALKEQSAEAVHVLIYVAELVRQ